MVSKDFPLGLIGSPGTTAVERANEYEATLRRFNNATPKHPSTAGSELEPRGRLPVTKLPSQGAGTHQSTQPTPIRSQFARLLARSTSSASAPPSTAPLDRPKGVSLPQGLVGAQAVPATAGLCQSDTSLLDALAQEQALRQAAETAAAQTNSEIEELTGQLFQQANEMVATERKVRARLEERVEVLERRDGEKARRLGVLERRVLRVERVRNLLEKDREGG